VDSALLERGLQAYGRALRVTEPVRLRFWDSRGLTMSQLRLMYLISQAENSCVGELAHEMRVRPATLTGLADRLARQQLIQRTHDPDDRRLVRVALTPEGKRVLDELLTAARALLEAILSRMETAAVEAFVESLEEFDRVAAAVHDSSEALL